MHIWKQLDYAMAPSPEQTPTDTGASGRERPDWVGHWRVRRYGGDDPSVPTYYDATPESWDVIKDTDEGLHVAPHPILEIRDGAIVLKDEGAADDEAERWGIEVVDGILRVVAETGPHEGAVGLAERVSETGPDHVFS